MLKILANPLKLRIFVRLFLEFKYMPTWLALRQLDVS